MTNSIPTVYRPNNIYRLTDRQRVFLRGVQAQCSTRGWGGSQPLRMQPRPETRKMINFLCKQGLVTAKDKGLGWHQIRLTQKGAEALERLDAPVRPGVGDIPVRVTELVARGCES